MRSVPMICLLATSACVEAAPLLPVNGGTGSPEQPPAPDTCGAAAYRPLIGQDVSMFSPAGRPGPSRIIRPGQVVTMDYDPERLNVQLDDDDRIVSVSCG